MLGLDLREWRILLSEEVRFFIGGEVSNEVWLGNSEEETVQALGRTVALEDKVGMVHGILAG